MYKLRTKKALTKKHKKITRFVFVESKTTEISYRKNKMLKLIDFLRLMQYNVNCKKQIRCIIKNAYIINLFIEKF